MEDLFCVWFNLWKSLKLLELQNYHADCLSPRGLRTQRRRKTGFEAMTGK